MQGALLGAEHVGFVPTMGALHEGHASLIRASKAECKTTVLSIFVNPLQFNNVDDLAKYPRVEERDFQLAEHLGVDVVFVPTAEELVQGVATQVQVSDVSRQWEGEHRPGHFEGVATIVLKLFNIVRPDYSFFGLKDLQQCAVIQRMVRDLNVPTQLKFCETIREEDGLAMSSRNERFSAEQRIFLSVLPQVLRQAVLDLKSGVLPQKALSDAKVELEKAGFSLDYLAIVNPETMQPEDNRIENSRLIFAGEIFGVRLIDNMPVA